MAPTLVYGLSSAAAFCGLAAHDPARPGAAVTPAASAARRRAGGLFRVRRRCRLPPLFEPELLRFRQQLPYRRPLGCKLPVMGTRAAGGYVGMSEGWLGTVCALFLRSFNAATTLLIDTWSCRYIGVRRTASTSHDTCMQLSKKKSTFRDSNSSENALGRSGIIPKPSGPWP